MQVDGRPQEPFLRSRWSFKFLQLKIADYFAAILHQLILIIHVRPVFSVVSHLEIYFDFAHRQSRLNFRLLLVLSFRCTSVRDSYCWAWLLRLELFYSSLSSASTGVTSRTSASANFRLESGGTPVAAGCSYPVERSWFE